ncbi:MAG TPA: hypothetical protein VL793_12705, partial [Patescibacteria group bacterium]|nr:hypothetical protein [Patescibacteria group bacterium]
MKNLLTIISLFILAAAPAKEPAIPISLGDFSLTGDLSDGRAAFTFQATARVENSHGGKLVLLRGPVALTDLPPNPKWHVKAEAGQFVLTFEHGGTFPLRIRFEAAVRQSNGWNQVDFSVAPTALQPLRLKGVPADTQLHLAGAAPPEFHNGEFNGFLAADGSVDLSWKEAPREAQGKLFYAAEMVSQLTVSPGLLRQTALLNFKVMQGELNQLSLVLHGSDEITRVQGEQVLSWRIEPISGSNDRRLLVQLNQPQKDTFNLQIQAQIALGVFPQTMDVLQLRPDSATRFAGYLRVVNEGAVRLEVTQASGLSQIAPEQFPETDLTRSLLRPLGNQRFVYRFSSAQFGLRIAADQILPELSVSELLSYHLGATEQAVDAEFELEIREAPLRELSLRIPAGYGIAHLDAA